MPIHKSANSAQIRPVPAERGRDLSLPSSRHTAAYPAKQGENAQGDNGREKNLLFVCIAYQDLTCGRSRAPCSFGQSAHSPSKVALDFFSQKNTWLPMVSQALCYPSEEWENSFSKEPT